MALGLVSCAPRQHDRAVRGLGDTPRRESPWDQELRPLSQEGPRFAENARRAARPAEFPASDLDRSVRAGWRELQGPRDPRPGRDEILGMDWRLLDPEGDIDLIGRDIGRFLAQLPPRWDSVRDYFDRVIMLRAQPGPPDDHQ